MQFPFERIREFSIETGNFAIHVSKPKPPRMFLCYLYYHNNPLFSRDIMLVRALPGEHGSGVIRQVFSILENELVRIIPPA
jgi:hypothetical protein